MRYGKLATHIACLGPVGYLKAPGTMATIVTVPLVFLVRLFLCNSYVYALFLCVLVLLGRYIIARACDYLYQSVNQVDNPSTSNGLRQVDRPPTSSLRKQGSNFLACDNGLVLGNHDDPSMIVLDELIGTFILFWSVPLTAWTVLVGVLLFRFFDITKIVGIRSLERYPHGWGIVLDDVAAGLISNVLLRVLVWMV
jgi:phosphatidylglycerophosphatase A